MTRFLMRLWREEPQVLQPSALRPTPAFPASPYPFALYLRHLKADAKTASSVGSAVHGIAWVHYLAGEQSPSEDPLVKDVLAGAQRRLAYHTSKKEPITVSQLEQL